MNTKSKLLKSIFISLILVMGVSNAWAFDQSNVDLYFDNSEAKWEKCYVYIGKSDYTSCYDMTRVPGTQYLWRVEKGQWNWGNSWDGATGWVVCYEKWWDNQKESIDKYTWHGAKNVTKKSTSAWVNTKIYKTNGTTSVSSDGNTINAYAVTSYTKSNYTVTINTATGGTLTVKDYDNNTVSNGASKIHLTVLKFSASASTGYTFGGVEINNGSSTTTIAAADITSKTYTLTSNVTITPIWTPAEYTITYKDQGNATFSGTHASGYPTTHTYGTATTLKTASKTGYTFEGWFTNSGCTGSAVNSLGATEYTANITLYAKWEQNAQPSVTITNTPEERIVINNSKVTIKFDYRNIPDNCYYRVRRTNDNGYFNDQDNNHKTTIIGSNGTATFTSYTNAATFIPTTTFEIQIYNSSDQLILTSSQIEFSVEQGFQIGVHAHTNGFDNDLGGSITGANSVTAYKSFGAEVSASEANKGYTFTGWTSNTNNITFEDASNQTTTVYATAAGDVYANFQSVQYNIYFVSKDNWSPADDNKFIETEPGIYTLTKLFDKRERPDTEFKLHINGKYYTSAIEKTCQFNRQHAIETINNSTNNAHYLKLQRDATGSYTFKYNVNNETLTVIFPDREDGSYLVGDFSDNTPGHGDDNSKDWKENEESKFTTNGANGTLEVCFPEGTKGSTWTFKVKINGIWYGHYQDNDTPLKFTENNNTYQLRNEYAYLSESGVQLETNQNIGCYTFNYIDHGDGTITLTIVYPEAKPVPVYLKLNDDWQNDDKRYAIYCWNNSGNTWVDMKKLDCDGYFYTATVPMGYNEFKFVQLGKNSGNSFDGDPKRTEDLTVPAGAANMYDMTSTKTTYLYLKPNDNWKKDNARFEANFDDDTKYVYMNDIDNGIYRCEKGNYTKVQFNRVNPNNGYIKWNKTGNLTIPTDGKNLFTVPNDSWDGATTTWSAIYDDSKWAELDEIPSFTITLNRQGGTTGTENITAKYGANVENITVPERVGYTFGGYYTNTNGEGDLYISSEGEWQNVTYIVDGKWDKPVCDLTLYAKWTPKKYQITYTAPTNGNYSIKVGSNTPVSENTEADCDQTITLSATPNPGYHFVGWTVTKNSGGTITVTDDKFTMPAEAVTVAATFEPNTYTITYKDQGDVEFSGTHEAGHPTQHTYATYTQLKGAGKIGYTFLGWFTNKECTEGPITTLGATAYTANITLYAKWEIRKLYIHADFVSWEGILVKPEFKDNSVVYTYTGILEEDASSYNNEHTIWDGGHHFHYLYSLEGIEKPETQKIAYNYNNVDAKNISYTQDLIDAVHLTDDNNPTIQFGLTKKSRVTITLTLVSDIETDDKATQPDVAIVAIPCNTITLDQTGARTQGTATSVEVPNGDPMPAITGDGALPTPQIGYTFMGYFDQKDGKGTQYYNADGTSEYTWDKTEDATLYAYFQPAKITNITLDKEVFEPVTSVEADVTATPTIDPSDIEGVVVCWRLLYSNGDEVIEHKAIDAGDNKVKFSIVGLATGTYTIEATLHTTACGNGDPLSTLTKNFIIASEYTVTVKYTCDNQEIKASTTAPAHATEPTTLEASDIFGYTFKEWVAGDGVEIKNREGKTITYTATYNGTITAKYTKRKLIYLDLSQKFSESGKWSSPYIYLYGSDGYWDNNKGAGATGDACKAKGAMTKIEGTDIWYYDYSNVAGFTKYLAFTWGNHTSAENFYNCDVIYRGDFSEGTPLFVPATDQTKEEKNGAKYYSKGYWVNYIGEHTGYTLIIYNEAGDKELIRQKFTSANKRMNMTSVIDLEAEHKYQYEVLRDHGYYYKHNSTQLTYSNKGPKPLNTAKKGTIITTAAGDYTFTLGYWSGDLQISVDYPAAVGDYRILYRDNGKTNWSGNTRPQNWCHPSRIIKKKEGAIDTISFFVNTKKEPKLLYQTIKSIDANTGAITWNAATKFEDVEWNVIEKDGVINFTFTQSKGAIAVTNIELYKGNYYIRVDAVDGKWGNYKTDPDNRMTYSAFSESKANSFGEKFSHYKTQWCPRGTNVKFTIANDYSPCITDTLIQDVTRTWDENIDQYGNLKSDGADDPTADKYSANIRFMWNRKDNKISRAYLSSATNITKKFLILQGDDKMKDAEGKEIAATEHVPADATLLDDKQNWIYETTIKVQPGARVKLYACYPEANVANAQYFRGVYDTKAYADWDNENSVQILGGTGETWNTMRVIYDFKTNRLMGAWVPDTEIGDNGLQIDADIMIMREHQEEATCINLTENANSKLTDVKTVYGVMRFNRWILNNRANPKDLDIDHCSTFDGKDRNYDEEKVKEHHPVLPLIEQKSIYERSLYFISFPFDVNLSDVFGFGTYWNEWYIEYYDGLKRAREGFFIDSPPNWKYVTPEMADTFKLRAYQGYILGLDLDYMQYDNTSFWTHNMQEVELFFPSTTTMGEIAKEEVTMPALGPKYECKINRPNSDHRVIDSYWRCIGVPSYANYDGLLYTDADKKQSITWKTDYTWKGDYSEFPFLYAWNTTDNTITPHSTTTFKFKTMHSYLVQHKDKIHWSAISTKPSPIVAKERNEATRNYEWKITLSRNEKLNDQTFIRMADREDITTEFDFNQDLSKEFNYGRSDIYTLIGYEKAAANSLPLSEQTTLIPLGLSIEYNGDYTIAMPDGTANIGVTLIDTESNTRTNLSAGMEYTLTLNKGDYNNRFFIEISPIQQTPTDIEYVTGDSNSQNSVRKVLIDNILYIVRDGQIFDARGARVK
ncbi:MAG: InlB B-repeat-containing protein [Paludibacteraceae bacterium]|nr:InlB B-repeat-containing protein [Paludibacteraceae bacterium]